MPHSNILRIGSMILVVVLAKSSQAEPREIEFGEIFSTTPQKGFQRAYTGRVVNGVVIDSEYGKELREIQRERTGASNAFLVDATNMKDVMNASMSVLIGYRSTDIPVTADTRNPMRGSLWLVAYLGNGHSSPPKWVVERILVSDGRVRLIYSKPRAGFQTADMHRYYYWVPLGKLDPGIYNVELYDSGLEAVTLMRRVEVKQ